MRDDTQPGTAGVLRERLKVQVRRHRPHSRESVPSTGAQVREAMMEVRVLGVVEALEDGLRVSLGGPKQRSLLAMLLFDPNRSVSTERLIDGLWGDDPPRRPAATLQVYVSNLRKVLE